jgi:AcrR family transcriptional regulator
MAPKKPASRTRRKPKPTVKAAHRKGTRRVRTGPVTSEQAADRRAHVLRIAGEQFVAHGFHGTSIDEIAQRSRVSKVTIYREYGDKGALFQQFFDGYFSAFRYDVDLTLRSHRPLKEVVRDVIRLVVNMSADKRTSAILRLAIGERNRFPKIARVVLDRAYDLARPLGDYLRIASGQRGMTNQEAKQRALHLMNMASGGYAALLDDPRTFYGDQNAWVESVADAFLESIPRRK